MTLSLLKVRRVWTVLHALETPGQPPAMGGCRMLWRAGKASEELSWPSTATDASKYHFVTSVFSISITLGKCCNETLTLFQEAAKKKSPWETSDLLISHGTLVRLRQHFQTIALQISRYNYTTSQAEKNNVGNSSNVLSQV